MLTASQSKTLPPEQDSSEIELSSSQSWTTESSATPTILINQPVTKVLSASRKERDLSRVRMVISHNEALVVPKQRTRILTHRGRIGENNWNQIRPVRAGIIVYLPITFKAQAQDEHQQLLFCMGVDSQTGDITDFGGGVTKKDKTVIHGALREFHEETLGIFSSATECLSGSSLAIWSERSFVAFVKLNGDQSPVRINECYRQARSDLKTVEVTNLIWLTQQDLVNLINKGQVGDHKMYDRIRTLLQAGGNFFNQL